VLPEVRKALASKNPAVLNRAIQIVAWQGDADALPTLRAMQNADAALVAWAIKKIETLHPNI
jgi:hypothetical protein